MFNFGRSKEAESTSEPDQQSPAAEPALETALQRKPFLQVVLPVFACGAGLFSDGYVNNVSFAPPRGMALPFLTSWTQPADL